MLGLTFSSKLDLGSYIVSIAKTVSKKIGALICYMRFLCSGVALYLYRSTITPLYGILLSYLGWCPQMLLVSLFCGYNFGRNSSELAPLVPPPFSQGRLARYSDRLHDFCVTIPRCQKDVYVSSFFPRTARLWNSLPIECFPLTYDLSGFKSRINRHLLTVGSF